jgi:hypothetical protein
MKPFPTYQRIPDTPMTERDKKQVGSKFWNEGKWENFVLPHLPESGDGLTLVDMGCNSGLFLKLAEDMGFRAIGVDSDAKAVLRGSEWKDKIGGRFELIEEKMENCLERLPIADYTTFVNSHYYWTINDWIEYVDKLALKTRYVIIVTAEKNHVNRCWASADVPSIRNYFKNWKEVSFVNELPLEGDPDPRRLWSLCFESPLLEKVEMKTIDSSNHVQDSFWGEIEDGKHYTETKYYRILKKYRAKWGQERLHSWLEERIKVYEDLKKHGQKVAILVDSFQRDRLLDGNNRYSMKMHLKDKHIYARFV